VRHPTRERWALNDFSSGCATTTWACIAISAHGLLAARLHQIFRIDK
jgi:hypothetical protein